MEMQQMVELLLAKMDAYQAGMKAFQERMDANTKSMREDIKSGQAKVRSIVRVFQDRWTHV
jgi:hypothetical protein